MEDKSYIQHSVKIEEIEFKNIEFAIIDPYVEKVSLKTGENGITVMTFIVTNDKLFECARKSVEEYLAEKILDKIAFLYSKGVGKSSFFGGYDSAKNSSIVIGSGCGIIHCAVKLVISEPDGSLIALMKELDNSQQNAYYKQFRFVMQNKDPVTRYMSLYRILLEIFARDEVESQDNVDNFIRNSELNVEQSPKPEKFQKPNKPISYETVYTRLRNEITHCRSGTSPHQTSREIETRVGQLTILTKKAIEQAVTST